MTERVQLMKAGLRAVVVSKRILDLMNRSRAHHPDHEFEV